MGELLRNLCVGWLLACTGAGHGGGAWLRGGEQAPAVWVACDRNRNQIVWLDERLIIQEVWGVARPTHLAWSGGRLWVVCDPAEELGGFQRISCYRRNGSCVASFRVAPVLDLVELPGWGALLMLTAPRKGDSELWLCDRYGSWWGPMAAADAVRWKATETGLWFLGAAGKVGWLGRDFGEGVQWTPVPDGLQTERGARVEGDRLWCRGASKSSLWRALMPGAKEWGRECNRPGLPPELQSQWPTEGQDRKPPSLAAWLDAKSIAKDSYGNWLLMGPESLWLLDSTGQPVIGQGGFGYLTGVVPLPRGLP